MTDNIVTYILIGFTLIFILIICIILIKYILNPLFLTPRFSTTETLNFLKKNDCTFIEYRNIKREERKQNPHKKVKKDFFDKILTIDNSLIVIGFSEKENLYRMYWLEIKRLSTWFGYGEKKYSYILESDKEINQKLNIEYTKEIIKISDKCPACQTKIESDEIVCSNCGLSLI